MHNRNGMLRLRWTYQGRGYSLAVGLPDIPINRAAAEAKAAQIQIDIALEKFDTTLNRYRFNPETGQLTGDLFEDFTQWKVDNGEIAEHTASNQYKTRRNYLRRFGSISSVADAERFCVMLQKRMVRHIYNNCLFTYKKFSQWAVKYSYTTQDYFKDISPLKTLAKQKIKRKPFTTAEVKRILEVFQTTEYLSHYFDFVLFLFCTGTRPSEAVGLRWASVDLDAQTVTIEEVIVRHGGHGKAIRKGTKNGIVRSIGLSDRALTMLKNRHGDIKPNDLVFTAPRGGIINAASFARRYWGKALQQAEVSHRPLYTTRHTLISHGIEDENWTVAQAADVAGDSVATVAKHYIHQINPPSMPDFDQ
ncbi:tyrosine-type recombinase/integrase [Leptothoe spongobia]|uniref:Tyrosine-type recombinase/integrase n=1 Tax=Leptothoe spongobia TAU-MAC 1115 TaxID=1967444 RepID=A0A947DCA5_9CYAN|nr:tyrosine-type recombinase/integrase [Leptothoe spongobia]MBT9314402.1 tyrosine-type recombinase/integrase [Leptothoe spongobia TAU-MAC 1115]